MLVLIDLDYNVIMHNKDHVEVDSDIWASKVRNCTRKLQENFHVSMTLKTATVERHLSQFNVINSEGRVYKS